VTEHVAGVGKRVIRRSGPCKHKHVCAAESVARGARAAP
jgi:hypothetical protein